MSPRHILIIGGGASGVILAAHLLRGAPGLRLTVVERRDRLGRGLAYDTPHDAHLLNTRAGAMSAFADRPGHFLDWLAGRGILADAQAFVPRHLYADYLEGLVAGDPRLRRERQECIALAPAGAGLRARLADGREILADAAVLATGHLLPGGADPFADAPQTDPWHAPLPPPDARVLILGTGLSMVDRVMRLLDAGHRGEIGTAGQRRRWPAPFATATSRPR